MSIGSITFDLQFVSGIFSIILIDLLLAGDNAVVIAMAVRQLPQKQRKKAIILGSLAAVLMRVVLTFFVAQLLQVSFVKLVGGVLILWIAAKLFSQGDAEEHAAKGDPRNIWGAVKLIIVADATMSLDNMLAVGGASHGNLFLLLFGLAVSIPFVVFTSNLLSKLMDRFPIILYAGGAVLGKVGAEMILTDPFVQSKYPFGKTAVTIAEIVFAAGVVVLGVMLTRARRARAAAALAAAAPEPSPAAAPQQ